MDTARCSACGRRLGVVWFECRCGNRHCSQHRLPETHACGFDFKSHGKATLETNNPRVVAPKIARV